MYYNLNVILLIELTSSCSHDCFGCGNVFEKKSHKNIDLQFLESFIPKLKNTVFDIRLTGGEPTLHPQFEEILELLDSSLASIPL